MSRYSAGDADTWDQYAGDRDLLEQAVTRIRAGDPIEPLVFAPSAMEPVSRPVEQRHLDVYEMAPPVDPVVAERRESELVRSFAAWLKEHGATVTAHHYAVVRPALRSDLADETARRIWEAKGDVGRASVRMALGQLLDYLRFEPEDWTGGILLPNRPSDDLLHLIHGAERATAWPTQRSGFEVCALTERRVV